jgi:anti-sigma regulatory factor (Ser/Thr protein kinase)
MAEHLDLRTAAQPEAVAELRHEVVGFANRMGADEAVGDAVRLAVSEALTNVVVHAYPGREPGDIAVEAWRDGNDQLVVVISDDGKGLLPRAHGAGLGFGLGLMAQMSDGFLLASGNGTPGTTVSLRFDLP